MRVLLLGLMLVLASCGESIPIDQRQHNCKEMPVIWCKDRCIHSHQRHQSSVKAEGVVAHCAEFSEKHCYAYQWQYSDGTYNSTWQWDRDFRCKR